ncbi:(2Fe-2S)-binding protein [Kitasatospora sp. NPDC093806]|uniref:(2Fe-2S)-binding protein n=1 Tax=Kitasatospora sp. NPDC093806 TaxID=3155075 RepID=UPI003428E5B9
MPDYGPLTAVGPYFALDAAETPDQGPPPGFRPLRELYVHGPDGLLADGVRSVARRIGTAEARVAASTLHLGLAARFCSVLLGSAVLLGDVPELDRDRSWVRVPAQGPVDLWVPDRPSSATTDHGPLADRLHRALLDGPLAELAAAVRSVVPLSEGLLRGNTASALTGALRMLDAHIARAGAAPAGGRAFARTLVADLLDRAPLTGTGTLSGASFRRSSCCLYYRVGPQAGVCGDCCFTRPPRRPDGGRRKATAAPGSP